MTSTRGPVVLLGGLAVLLVGAGVLPWVAGGSAAARGFAVPLFVVGLFAAYAGVRGGRAPTAAPTAATAPVRTNQDAGCGGCQCGAGGCGAATADRAAAAAAPDAD